MAAQLANTRGATGENDTADDKPTLKEYLANLPDIHAKLEQHQMTDIDTFIYIHEKDLEDVCGEHGVALSVLQRVKFRSAVRKLQQKYTPKKQTHVVAISQEERKALDELKFTAKLIKNY